MISETKDIDIINSFLTNFNTTIKEIGIYSNYYLYEENNEKLGFICFDIIYDRAEIEYIYTVEKVRRKNVASKLFDAMLKKCDELNCENITLEVRQTNEAAIKFYEKMGFIKTAVRKNYYNDEDGLLMIKELRK